MTSTKKITDFVSFNPKRTIKKGETKPFVEMAALPVDSRDISEIGSRTYKGGGSRFQDGDTLFARITPCLENGKTAKASGLGDGVIAHGSTEFIVLAAKEPEYDEDYVYYLARMPEFRAYAQSRMEGTSGRQRVSWRALAEFEFDFPDKEDRKEIGRILKSIDDKIQVNNQLNQTLEQIAQAIFKSWFVDFEPVKAKIAVLEAGGTAEQAELAAMSVISAKDEVALQQLQAEQPDAYNELAQTAALFPAAMEESELGEIPEGWGVKRIGGMVERFSVGKKYSQKTASEKGSIPILDQGKSGIIGYHSDKPGVLASPEDPIIVFANHTCYMRLILHDFSAIQNVLPFKGKDLNIFWTYYATLGKQEFIEYKGHWPDFAIKEVVVPKIGLDRLFGERVSSLVKSSFQNEKQNSKLSELRDALLPRLLSGELPVGTTNEVSA